MKGNEFTAPDPVDLLAFFGAEPVDAAPEDGYWCYAATDARGIELRFSFNLFERSVQTTLSSGGVVMATVSHEGARAIVIEGDELRCEFDPTSFRASASVRLGDALRVEWTTLRTS